MMNDIYFDWMCSKACKSNPQKRRYSKLLAKLSRVQYEYSNAYDGNREADGIDLRYMFASENDIPQYEICRELDHTMGCSVLEMMVALSIRMEEIMYDLQEFQPNRWFWSMIQSLGLRSMDNKSFDEETVDYILTKWMNGLYDRESGQGGLFVLRDNRGKDLTTVEVWCQAMWYLSEVSYGT